MSFLETVKEAAKEFFSDYDPNARFLAKLTVYTHSIHYGLKDEEPRHIVDLMFGDPKLIEKYGLHIKVESKKLYMTTRTGDKLMLWLEENPDYDGKHPETNVRLADRPH